jgi:hypothetical protein
MNPNNFEWLIPVIFVIILAVRSLAALVNAGNQNPPNRRPIVPRPAADDNPNDPLKGEIEEFLKRVSNRRDGQNPQGQGQARPSQAKPQPGRRSPPPPPGERRKRPTPVIVARTAAPPAVPVEEQQQSVAEHVKRFLSTTEFEQRSEKLDTIAAKERQFEQQVQQTFTHQLGSLRPTAEATAAAAAEQKPPVARMVVPLLSGLAIRNAIIMNEVLTRPEHRWD